MNRLLPLLRNALNCPVLEPAEPSYQQAMQSIFFAEAAASHPSAIVQPRTSDDVAQTVSILQANRATLTVRGGGLSRECAHNDVVMVDLSRYMDTAVGSEHQVTLGGGATMGTALNAVKPWNGALPIGVALIPGLGLATRGGIGYLTRSHGLTMDHLSSVDLVVPSGDIVTLSDDSTGEEKDLWWAVRGCAPHFGIVTSATFHTIDRPQVQVLSMAMPLERLADYFDVAPRTPRSLSISAVIGSPPERGGEPVLFLMAVNSDTSEGGIHQTRMFMNEICGQTHVLWENDGVYHYMGEDMPGFAVPPLGAGQMREVSSTSTLFSKSPMTSSDLNADTAAAIVELARRAPTPECRIDIQHVGGALADTSDDATAFWGRSAEFSCPINAVWQDPNDAESCRTWARDVSDVYRPHQVGIYSVELRSGLPETGREVQTAFGTHLPKLLQIKEKWDPNGLLREYFPLRV